MSISPPGDRSRPSSVVSTPTVPSRNEP
jgi:hypothetical protein